MSEELPLFPVTGWEISDVPAFRAVIVRPSFLSHAMQTDAEADPGRRYLLTIDRARELARSILAAADRAERGDGRIPRDQKQ